MIINDSIVGKYVRMRSVVEEDSDFILRLRNNPDISIYLPKLEVTSSQQKSWITKQRNDNDSFYFLMETPFGESIGTISVYDINDNEGEVGRFCSFGSPFSNIEGCIMLYDFCFDILKLHKVKIWVYEDNKPVIELDQSFGYQWVGNTVAQDGRLCRVGEMTPSQYMEKRTEIAKKLKLKEKYF